MTDDWQTVPVGQLVSLSSGDFIGRDDYKSGEGDVIVVGAGGPMGKTAQPANTGAPAVVIGRVGAAGSAHYFEDAVFATDNTLIAAANPALRPRYLYHFLRSIDWAPLQSGSSQPLINQRTVSSLQIPDQPLAMQDLAVELIDAVEVRQRSAADHAISAQRAIDRFRRSVLAAACSGRLTADWRGSSSAAATDFRASAYIDGRDRIEPADGWIFDLPDTWQVVSLDQLTSFITSGSRGWAKYYAEEGALFIRAQNINKDRLDLTDIAYVQPPRGAEGERTKVQVDDLLVTITGANVTKSARVAEQIGEAYVNQHIALARLLVPEMSGYLHLWLISPGHGRAKLENDAYGAGRPGLNLHNLRSTPVGLPPRNEQAEIVRRVEELLQLADGLQARIDAASKHVDRSSQAVLRKAFLGELVRSGGTS